MGKSYKRYWDDIRKTFLIYSLAPVLSLLLIGYPLVCGSFLFAVHQNNDESNRLLAQQLEQELRRQEEAVDILAELPDIRELFAADGQAPSPHAYAQVYEMRNRCSLRPDCYVLDAGGDIVLSTVDKLPDYLQATQFLRTVLAKNLQERPEDVLIEAGIAPAESNHDMCVGRAVTQDGEVVGYVLFNLPRQTLYRRLLGTASVAHALTDPMGHLYAGSLGEEFLDYGKLLSDIRGGAEKVTVDGRANYVSSRSILDGQVEVYTLTDAGYLDTVFFRIGALLLAASVLLTALLLLTSRRFARRKARVLDNMVLAVENVRNGDLTRRLDVDSGDEFQLFAEEYNRMLLQLERQMQLNKEIGRQTVLSEIKQLEVQFNPHFLFNTLETIKYMIPADPSAARKMIVVLADILRYTIRSAHSLSRLGEDWQYAEQYLVILHYRFGESLSWTASIAPEAMDCMVPKLVFQPIIENAVTYGFGQRTALHIDVAVAVEGGVMTMTIHNDGDPIDPDRLEELRAFLKGRHDAKRHIGLYNIHRRVQLLYGGDYGVEIDSTAQTGTTVQIRLPAQRGIQDDSSRSS